MERFEGRKVVREGSKVVKTGCRDEEVVGTVVDEVVEVDPELEVGLRYHALARALAKPSRSSAVSEGSLDSSL